MSAATNPTTAGPSRGGGLLGWVSWAVIALASAAAGACTLAAAASIVAEVYPLQAAGFTVAGIALFASLLLPIALSTGLIRTLRRRGSRVRPIVVTTTTVLLTNIAIVVGVQVGSPVPVPELLATRGTWVVDAMIRQGPFGPAALPVLGRDLDALMAAKRVADASPMWCDATSAAFAVGLADGLRAGAPLPLSQALGGILDRYGVDPAQPVPDGVDGGALLADVMDVATASGPTVDLPPQAEIDATPKTVERTRITFTTDGWEARYEHGRWRWCTGAPSLANVRGHAYAVAMRDEAARVPTPTGAAAGPWDGDVRAALQTASIGRSSWLLGASKSPAGWTESLTKTAAAAQAERIRTWCAVAAKDPARAAVVSGVATRYTLPAPGKAIDPSVQALLDAQGRRYLEDVIAACEPVAGDRQVQEAGQGLSIPDGQRKRWAELEARSLASAAVLTDDGTGGVRIEVDGRTLRAVQEDGAWRIDWRD